MPNIGIVAAGGLLGAAESSGPAVGPTLIDFDFINEVYEVNGVPTTASAIITTPGDVGASGLNIPLLGTPNTILGDAATILLAAEWTIAIEFEAVSTSGNMHLFSLAETPIAGSRDFFVCGYPASPFQWWAQDDDASFTPRTCVVGTRATGIHQMAITRTDSRLIVAVDGDISLAAVSSKILDEIDTATFGGPAEDTNGREANIRLFAAYEPQTDAVLLVLSGGTAPTTTDAVGTAAGLGSANGAGQAVGGVTEAVGAASGTGMMAGVGDTAAAPLDGLSNVTGAWSFSRDLLTSFGGGTRYTKSGSAIITLEDQSGNNRDFSDGGISTRRPTETTAGPNSVLCADFDGTTDVLLTAVATSQLITASSGAIVLSGIVDVVTLNNVNPFNNHGLCGTQTADVIIGARNNFGPKGYSGNNDGVADQTADTDISTGTAYVFMWRHHGGTLYWSINGEAEVSISSGNTADLSDIFLLGVQSNFTDMKLFEIFTTSDGSQTSALATAIADMKSHVGA